MRDLTDRARLHHARTCRGLHGGRRRARRDAPARGTAARRQLRVGRRQLPRPCQRVEQLARCAGRVW